MEMRTREYNATVVQTKDSGKDTAAGSLPRPRLRTRFTAHPGVGRRRRSVGRSVSQSQFFRVPLADGNPRVGLRAAALQWKFAG